MIQTTNIIGSNLAEVIAGASVEVMNMPCIKDNLPKVSYRAICDNQGKPVANLFFDGVLHGISATLMLLHSGKLNLTFLEKERKTQNDNTSE